MCTAACLMLNLPSKNKAKGHRTGFDLVSAWLANLLATGQIPPCISRCKKGERCMQVSEPPLWSKQHAGTLTAPNVPLFAPLEMTCSDSCLCTHECSASVDVNGLPVCACVESSEPGPLASQTEITVSNILYCSHHCQQCFDVLKH